MKRFLMRKILMPFGLNLELYNPRPFTRFLKESKKKNLVGIEIGVLDGWNALDMLENLPIKKLYLIDPYMAYTNYEEYNENQNKSQQVLEEKRNIAIKVLKKYEDKIKFIRRFSEVAINDFKDNSLDFVYIDGNHQYEYVKKDIELYFLKIKKGGILGGHDYYLCDESKKSNCGVVKAVRKIFPLNRISFMNTDWWVRK
ncbi:hypothetical protein LCGC14_0462420 [marine sediment metagenome]|uniref:Methyltransferase domain-containing protein n=1 Tax=marine sediment metagenome TaxID=412755 RepID=A0A0F9VNN6_9ZZZZ